MGLTLTVSPYIGLQTAFAKSSQSQLSQQTERLDDTQPSQTAQPQSLDTLSAEAKSVANDLEIWNAILQYDALRSRRNSGEQIGAEYIEARQNLLETLMYLSENVRTFVHFIEEEISKADAVNAMIAARRDRALKLNTYGDLISGGISGAIGGGLAIADLNHISYDTIDAVEGVVQTALAVMSLKEQRGEKKIEKGFPNILARLFEPEKGPSPSYPDCIWRFLNTPESSVTTLQTRRQKLVDEWTKSGFCVSHQHIHKKKGGLNERRERITNLSQQNYRITAELIEDRIAMLHQLRSTVTRLDVLILEILSYMRSKP